MSYCNENSERRFRIEANNTCLENLNYFVDYVINDKKTDKKFHF
jgi:hypothetical protein